LGGQVLHGGTQICTATHAAGAHGLHRSHFAQGSLTITIIGTAHGAIFRWSLYFTQ
jgi:hypothetical protein